MTIEFLLDSEHEGRPVTLFRKPTDPNVRFGQKCNGRTKIDRKSRPESHCVVAVHFGNGLVESSDQRTSLKRICRNEVKLRPLLNTFGQCQFQAGHVVFPKMV